MQNISLTAFIKGNHSSKPPIPGCASYDTHYGGCVYAVHCKVEQGKRCGYFERAVLPVAAQLGIGGLIGDAYADKVHLVGFRPKMTRDARLCGCGAPLKPRQRLCEKCAVEKRRKTYREGQRKSRLARLSRCQQLTESTPDKVERNGQKELF